MAKHYPTTRSVKNPDSLARGKPRHPSRLFHIQQVRSLLVSRKLIFIPTVNAYGLILFLVPPAHRAAFSFSSLCSLLSLQCRRRRSQFYFHFLFALPSGLKLFRFSLTFSRFCSVLPISRTHHVFRTVMAASRRFCASLELSLCRSFV
jgi:hypothetical protein